MEELNKILQILKVNTVKEALQRIELFKEWNKQDCLIISKLRNEIKNNIVRRSVSESLPDSYYHNIYRPYKRSKSLEDKNKKYQDLEDE